MSDASGSDTLPVPVPIVSAQVSTPTPPNNENGRTKTRFVPVHSSGLVGKFYSESQDVQQPQEVHGRPSRDPAKPSPQTVKEEDYGSSIDSWSYYTWKPSATKGNQPCGIPEEPQPQQAWGGPTVEGNCQGAAPGVPVPVMANLSPGTAPDETPTNHPQAFMSALPVPVLGVQGLLSTPLNTGAPDFVPSFTAAAYVTEQDPLGREVATATAAAADVAKSPVAAETALPLPVIDEEGQKTTVMLRNIPNRYSQSMLVATLNHRGFENRFNFLYAPVDFQNRGNMGYAFINFVSAEAAHEFTSSFDGYRLPSCGSQKVCSASWARLQGFNANVDHLINNPVNDMPDEFKPILIDTETGQRIPFPKPRADRASIRPRKHRGCAEQHKTKTDKVFLGGLGPEIDQHMLEAFCGQFGDVAEVAIIRDRDTGVSRGFGFVGYHAESAANALLAAPPAVRKISGRPISVKPYTSNR